MNDPTHGKYVAQSSYVQQQPDECLAVLSKVEFQVLRDGDTNDAKQGRDLFLGIFFTALVGAVGLIATIDWDAAFQQKHYSAFVWTGLLFAIALAAACGWGICARNFRRTRQNSAHATLMKRLSDHFSGPASD